VDRVRYPDTGREAMILAIPICDRQAMLAVLLMFPGDDEATRAALAGWVQGFQDAGIDQGGFCQEVRRERTTDLP
jgi:hypothetical protein